jgi:hypothetical protein
MPAGFLICENLLPVPGEIVLWYCGRAVRIDEELKRGGAGRSARSRARATTKVSIQTSADPRLLTYLQFYQKRLDGRSAPEIAAALEAGSPAELYTELKNYGFPVCEVCGATPVTGVHCKVPQTKHERQARGSGPAKELPPATAAAPLFEDAIEALSYALENLEHRWEYIQGGRFVVGEVFHDPVYFPRSSFSDAEWQTLCESYNVDPDAPGFWDHESGITNAGGATKAPAAPLPLLIGVYALWSGHLGELVRVLHPEPEKANLDRIGRLLHGTKTKDDADGLLRIAEQLATEVRGLRTGRGAPPPPVSAREHNLACQVTFYRERGLSDEEIYKKWSKLSVTRDDVSRLGGLKYRWPED